MRIVKLASGMLVFTLLQPTGRGHAQDTESTWVDESPHTVSLIAVSPDVQLEVLDWGGAGEALVFLAGLSMNAHSFDGIAPRFRDRHRVIGITRRGHGASTWPASGYDLTTLARDVVSILDSLAIGRAVLAGHSMAGSELTRIASEHPDRVLGLVYIDAVQDYSHVPLAMQHCPSDPEFENAAEERFVDAEAFRRTQRIIQDDGAVVPNALPEAMGQIVRNPQVTDYSLVRAPALAIAYVPERIEEIFFDAPLSEQCRAAAQRITYGGLGAFAATMQRGSIVALRNSQHNIHLVSPTELENAMRRWMEQVSQAW